jgi:hypothetical protein
MGEEVKALSWLATTAAVVAAVAGSVVFVSGGSPAAAADTPPPIVEDYSYPGAKEILDEHQLELIKGDGHILFVTSIKYNKDGRQCATGQIQVEKSLAEEPFGVYYCFKTVGTKGWLTLKVPATFGVRGGDKPLEATASLPQGTKTFPVPANLPVAISPGDGNETPKAVLVELRLNPA